MLLHALNRSGDIHVEGQGAADARTAFPWARPARLRIGHMRVRLLMKELFRVFGMQVPLLHLSHGSRLLPLGTAVC